MSGGDAVYQRTGAVQTQAQTCNLRSGGLRISGGRGFEPRGILELFRWKTADQRVHPVLCLKHCRLQARGERALKERDAEPLGGGSRVEAHRRKLLLVPNKHDAP